MAEKTISVGVQSNNSVVVEICPTKLSDKREKTYQKKTWGAITNAITGLFNSYGGTLILRYYRRPPRGHVRKCMRMLEQKIQEFLGTISLTFDIDTIKIPRSFPKGHGEIKIIVKTSTKTEHMITSRLHIYLPSSQLVMEIPPSDVEKLRALLMENIPSVEPIVLGSHHRNFVKGELVSFSESKTTQFKNLEDAPAKRTTFSTRLVGKGNKFTCYVSAFANYAGGHMYTGIDDDGKVEGEILPAKEKEKVKKKIRQAIEKMKWPKKGELADTNEDQRWDVHFEPVKDNEDSVIPSLYVVVVFVAQCRGGVFTEEPECYEIVDNHKVQKVDFASWKRMIDPRLTEEGTSCANAPWDLVYEELTNRLNNNCNRDELDAASKTAQENYKISDVKLTCLSKHVSFHLRKGEYDKAEEILIEYSNTLPTSANQTRAKVMEQYLYSIMERCKGDYHKSYEIAKKCLNDLIQLPVSNISAAFYVQIATLENILAMKIKNREEMLSLLSKAEETYDIANGHLDQLQGHNTTKAEYQQKIYINKALLHLGCSLSGDMLLDSEKLINIRKAQEYLSLTQQIIIYQGHPLSKFRKIQNLFAQACLSYRVGNDDPSRHTELLKHAVDYSKEAQSLARDFGFAEMMTYAEKFIKFFETKLVVHLNN